MSAPNLALVAVVHGRACVLHMDADEGITDYVEDLGPDAMSDFKWPSDGVWVCELRMVDIGESDWPGARAYALGDPVHMRAPTAVEWGRHLDEEHLWRTAEQVAAEPVGDDATDTNECGRCSLKLHSESEATDCHYCDPLCPVWGTHGDMWDGDESSSRAAYLAATK